MSDTRRDRFTTPPANHNRLPALAADIRQAHHEVQTGALALAERAIDAGHALVEAKSLVPHGGWTAWLRGCGLNDRTAQRYMALARAGMKPATVAVMGLRAASASIAKRPVLRPPAPGEAMRIERILPGGNSPLFAYMWRSVRHPDFFEFVAFDAWKWGSGVASTTTLRRPIAWRGVPALLSLVGLSANDRIVRFAVPAQDIEEMRQLALTAGGVL